jgi:N-acetylmuramoyl-L-alanine amidase
VNTGTSSGNQSGSTTTSTTTKTYATVVGTDSLNIRVTPDGTVCGSLKEGTKVEILEQKTVNGRLWGRCSKGWICLRTYAKLETVTVNSSSTKLIGKVTASALNIRSGTGTGYSVVGKLYKGETVEILEKKTVNGTTWGRCSKGWVSLDYVQF